MRVETLSDHSGAQLQRSEKQLRAAQAGLDTAHRGHLRAADLLRTARRSKPIWRRILRVPTRQEREALTRTRAAERDVVAAFHARQQAHDRVGQQAAGVRAEDELEVGLSGLSDEWTMLRGYRNRRGETDHVLVGPLGVWAVEVKRRRVRLHIDADQWWCERLDARGRPVEVERAVDGGGRSWGRQVGDVAEDLTGWLRRNGHPVEIRTAVLLLHERAQVGRCRRQSVTLVGTHPGHLLHAISAHAARLTSQECAAIATLIRRDHTFHAGRRHSRRGPDGTVRRRR